MELIIGLLLLAGNGYMENGNGMDHPDRGMETLCIDLAALHTYGWDPSAWIPLYYAEWDIEWQEQPFDSAEKGMVCHSQKVENGAIHSLFIRIQ